MAKSSEQLLGWPSSTNGLCNHIGEKQNRTFLLSLNDWNFNVAHRETNLRKSQKRKWFRFPNVKTIKKQIGGKH
jgi:hypothetical protein